jgi:hypothetical protein
MAFKASGQVTGLQVKRESMITITMDEDTAGTMTRALGRMLSSVDHMTPERRTWLINLGTVDAVLALQMAIMQELP